MLQYYGMQYVTVLMNFKKMLYILTGSTIVDKSKIKHSGAGRIHRMIMRPMSLYESKESNGKICILDLFDNPK